MNASPVDTAANRPALEMQGVSKDFPAGMRGMKLRAVEELSLRVAVGEVYGLLGGNGSGKSTTIKLLLGLIQPTAGQCEIFSLRCEEAVARLEVGYMPDSPTFPKHLTGRQLVRFHGQLGGSMGAALEERVREMLELVGLTGAADRRVGTYSKGMLQRIGLAQALVHRPRLVIMDEPAAGLDVVGIAALGELIARLKSEGRTVFITSHLLGPIERVCDRVGILDHGRLVFEGPVTRGAAGLALDSFSTSDLAELRDWCEARGKPFEVARRTSQLERLLEETGRRLAPR